MYWYNPTTRTSERVEAPSTDEQAIQMIAGTQDSSEFIKEYCELRRSGTPIEQALVLVGHEFRMRQMEYQLAPR
jgi:type II secretory pathway component PulF